jgi:hypothetical protein
MRVGASLFGALGLACAPLIGLSDAEEISLDAGTALDGGDCPPSCSGTTCPACKLPNAQGRCAASECEIESCDDGYADCDVGQLDHHRTGCETKVASDPRNCGACANACSAATGMQPLCVAGKCAAAICPAGTADCTGDGTCETPLTTPQNCGFCGNACASAPAHGSPTCADGKCDFACDRFDKCARSCINPFTAQVVCAASCQDCGSGEECSAGLCGCPVGMAPCGTTCQDCSGGKLCVEGVCQCPVGTKLCSGTQCQACCFDTDCAPGMQCCAGSCAASC